MPCLLSYPPDCVEHDLLLELVAGGGRVDVVHQQADVTDWGEREGQKWVTQGRHATTVSSRRQEQ
jgi:hypothetical protein